MLYIDLSIFFRPDHQHQIATVIDELGKASAKVVSMFIYVCVFVLCNLYKV